MEIFLVEKSRSEELFPPYICDFDEKILQKNSLRSCILSQNLVLWEKEWEDRRKMTSNGKSRIRSPERCCALLDSPTENPEKGTWTCFAIFQNFL